MTARLPGHLDLIAAAPDGIRKLRGLILELAVRGKLVPQDSNDEPASELLKRVDAERRQLKLPPVPPTDDATGPFSIPNGWKWLRFGDVAQHNSGKTLDKGRNTGHTRRYITTSNLYWGRFDLANVREMLIRDEELERCTARRNDLLICEGGEAGRAAVWDGQEEISFQNHVHRARFFAGINPYYAYRIFQQLDLSGEINQFRKGVGISNLSGKALASIPFPLPPLAEQHRIVAKVDELMALCDRLEAEQTDADAAQARLVETLLGTLTQSSDDADLATNWQRLAEHFATLFTSESSLDALKQTILQLAVMGKLVPQDPNDEPASELLKRIAQERARLEAEGVCKKSKPLPPVGEDEQPFEVPNGWAWVRLSDVTVKITDGTHHSPPNLSTGDFKYISAKNIKPWGIDQSGMTFVTKPVHDEIFARCNPEFGDVLYIKDGATTGIATINTLTEPFSMLSSVALLKPSIGLFNRYLYFLMSSPVFYDEMRAGMTGVAITRVTLAKLNAAILPLPPLAEQHRIVAKVDELLALCDRLKADLAESRRHQERLASTLIDTALAAA